MGRFAGWMVAVAVVLSASAAAAVDPSIKCQSDKLRLAAKYMVCRLNAEAGAARTFSTPDFGKCGKKFLAGWEKAERRAMGKGVPCWTTGDAEQVKGSIDAHTSGLASALDNGGDE